MTNNTIPNVPRELLDSLLTVIESNGYAADEVEVVDELRALLSAPSPAGVDGLPEFLTPELEAVGREAVESATQDGCNSSRGLEYAYGEAVRKSVVDDAQAIIDGLRGEVARSKQFAAGHVLTNERISARLHAVEEDRDQQAQRIGELEGLLRHAQKQVPTGSGLHMRIDAALSAVCAAAPNTVATSEHNADLRT